MGVEEGGRVGGGGEGERGDSTAGGGGAAVDWVGGDCAGGAEVAEGCEEGE